MERELLLQIWPIFSAEAREHLSTISSGFLELERDPAQGGVLDGIKRTAHSLKGSAASLGIVDVERLAHAIEGSLAGFDASAGISADMVQAALDAVEAIEEALTAADAGAEPRVGALPALLAALGAGGGPERASAPPRRAAPRAGQEGAGARAASDPGPAPRVPAAALAEGAPGGLEALEDRLARLCAPIEADARRALALEAAAVAEALAAEVPAAAREPARRIAAAFPRLGEEGNAAARVAAALAGDLVDLRQALDRSRRPASQPAPASAAARAGDKSIRVLASTLDSLARQLELLALAESRHQRRARDVAGSEAATREVLRGLERAAQAARLAGAEPVRADIEGAVQRMRGVASDLRRVSQDGQRDAEQQRLAGAVLREDLRALRMVPAALVMEPLHRAVHDVAGRLGKEVELELVGGDVRLDRRIVDALRDPLLHLVRNAVDHGVEPPDVRRAAGKPPGGRVRVRVEPRGSRVGMVVEDDGAGLDLDALRASAVRKGVVGEEVAARMSDADAARLIFTPGLSTAQRVSEISGRGVGLDVVQETVTRLQGAVDVRFTRGLGTQIDLELPLTLAATNALLFRIGRDLAVLPGDALERVLLLSSDDVGTVAGRAMVRVDGEQLPYTPLAQLLGMGPGEPRRRQQPALVLALGAQRVVVAVDEVIGQQDVVITSLGGRVAGVSHLAGASVLDDGRVVGVLAAAEVLRRALPGFASERTVARPRIVVADDALTTRAAMKALLEIAGYSVLPAADGEEAFALVRDQGCQLVVTDVQMPRLDGFGLARRLKSDPRWRSIPVVLVTSLEAPEDRAAGLEAGADGYLVKREVERGKLLELVRQLLPGRT